MDAHPTADQLEVLAQDSDDMTSARLQAESVEPAIPLAPVPYADTGADYTDPVTSSSWGTSTL